MISTKSLFRFFFSSLTASFGVVFVHELLFPDDDAFFRPLQLGKLFFFTVGICFSSGFTVLYCGDDRYKNQSLNLGSRLTCRSPIVTEQREKMS